MQAVGTYINGGALNCPFCYGLLQEDDDEVVECQSCLEQWALEGNRLKLVECFDQEEADAGRRAYRKANGRKMKVSGVSVKLLHKLAMERLARIAGGG